MSAIGCLNPLSTGKSVQTLHASVDIANRYVLIPYLQGSLFRLVITNQTQGNLSLNPLSTGKSVQTKKMRELLKANQS